LRRVTGLIAVAEQELRHRLEFDGHAVLERQSCACGIQRGDRTVLESFEVAAHQHRQAEVDRIAVEEPGEGGSHHAGDAQGRQRLGRLLAR